LKELLSVSIRAALSAGFSILEIYDSYAYSVREKEDKSPLTEADLKSQEIICSFLSKTDYPILSEEEKDISYEERKHWERFWLVDPLDGTKEFIKRNGEFTVNIALIENERPILGVVYAPVLGDLYFASKDIGAYKLNVSGKQLKEFSLEKIIDTSEQLGVTEKNNFKEIIVVASRSHMSEKTKNFVERLKEKEGNVRLVSKGSSLKLCLIAEGRADIYPRFAPSMEWDTAAGQAIVETSGGKVIDAETGKPLKYNKESLLNPPFIAVRKDYEL